MVTAMGSAQGSGRDATLSAYWQTFGDKLTTDKRAGPKCTKVPVGLLAQIRARQPTVNAACRQQHLFAT